LILWPFHSMGAMPSATEIWWACSSGSKSVVVVPSSICPRRVVALEASRSASASMVLPAPPWPTRATLRMLAGSYCFKGVAIIGVSSFPTTRGIDVIDSKAREALTGVLSFAGRVLSRLGFTANRLTALGIVLSAVAAWRIADGAFLAGGILLAVGGLLDVFDGAVAKHQGKASPFGAFFDSVSDRLSDALIFSALIWFFFGEGNELVAGVALAAYATAMLTSYLRAKADSLGFDAHVGIVERAERLIVLAAGLILGFVEIALWVLAVGGLVTALQRVVRVSRQARAAS
jgi:CDP-diacylglycerol---glycerol-3-phosphate 3-phosphatidyltransferase